MPAEGMLRALLMTGAIVCGCVLDLIFADPVKLPHPVVLMGACITRLERSLRSRFRADTKGELAGGRVLAAILPSGVFAFSFAVCLLAWRIHPALFFAVESIWCAQALAARGLAKEALAVRAAICRSCRSPGGKDRDATEPAGAVRSGLDSTNQEEASLHRARRQVARIVGRDTDSLDEAGIIRACVETVAENSSDGVIAPLLYMLINYTIW